MNDCIVKKRLLFIGPYPEPKGGVSVHIERLRYYLCSDFEIEIIDDTSTKKKYIFSTRSLNLFKYYQIIKRADVVHIHSGILLFKVLHVLSCWLLRKRIIFTFHSTPRKSTGLIYVINKYLLNRCDVVIFVNNETKEIFNLKGKTVCVKNAFLPPIEDDVPLPIDVISWFEKQSNNIIFCANGWKLTYHNGSELYGLDLCVELIKRLADQGISCALIFTMSKLNTSGILEKNMKKIAEYGLQNHILISTQSLPFIQIIKKSDIVLRPTNTDGDALTIREGLFLGKKVISSDVVKRPEGTIIFKNRDIDDLVKVVKHEIGDQNNVVRNHNESLEEYLNFYKDVYGGD